MNVAAIKYHFGDKERLYAETVTNAHRCGMPDMLPGQMSGWSADTSPADRLRAFIGVMARTMHEPVRPSALQLVMREFTNPSAVGAAVVREFIHPMAMRLWAIVGELFPHLPESRRLMIGFSIVGQCLYYRQNRAVSELLFGADHLAALDADAVSDHITRFTLAALGLGEPYHDRPEGEP